MPALHDGGGAVLLCETRWALRTTPPKNGWVRHNCNPLYCAAINTGRLAITNNYVTNNYRRVVYAMRLVFLVIASSLVSAERCGWQKEKFMTASCCKAAPSLNPHNGGATRSKFTIDLVLSFSSNRQHVVDILINDGQLGLNATINAPGCLEITSSYYESANVTTFVFHEVWESLSHYASYVGWRSCVGIPNALPPFNVPDPSCAGGTRHSEFATYGSLFAFLISSLTTEGQAFVSDTLPGILQGQTVITAHVF